MTRGGITADRAEIGRICGVSGNWLVLGQLCIAETMASGG
jgi:hypothetical protein